MADTAFQIQYRKETIMGFEAGQSNLRKCVVHEAVIKGNQATFQVADSGGATAVTRGVNGRIPARANNRSQLTVTLVEQHDLAEETNFNVFASQGDGRAIMQITSQKVINRTIDLDILAEASNATTAIAAAGTASLALVMRCRTKLGNNAVDIGEIDNMFAAVSPAFMAYLLQIPEFVNSQWVDVKPLTGPAMKMLRWAGFNWIESPLISGIGTASELVYFFHRNAIGHAANVGEMTAIAGYNEEQDYSFARTSIFVGTKLLQNKGIVKVTHDGSAYA